MRLRPYIIKSIQQSSKGSFTVKAGIVGMLGMLSVITVFGTYAVKTPVRPIMSKTGHGEMAVQVQSGAGMTTNQVQQPITPASKPHVQPGMVARPQSTSKNLAANNQGPTKNTASMQQRPQGNPAAVKSNEGGSITGTIYSVFGPNAPAAIHVAQCESGLNPGAYNPASIGGNHATGLFQILYPSTWQGTSQAANAPTDATANILAAHEIFVRDGYSWREWTCKP